MAKKPSRRVEEGPGRILHLIATGQANTRTKIGEATELSRSTVLQRLEVLQGAGLVRETEDAASTGGRPSRLLALEPNAGRFAAIDIGEERTRIAITDLDANILVDHVQRFRLDDGPEVLLDRMSDAIVELLKEPESQGQPLTAMGVGLPAPVEFDSGQILGWSIMPGWEEFDIRGYLAGRWDVPILIDNDVNLLTLAEFRRYRARERHLFYIKVGTGIGSGMIIDGALHRGAQGAAGDIGHARVQSEAPFQCRCGSIGCLEAVAGGWALARDLHQHHGLDIHEARDIAELVRRGDGRAISRLREAGRAVGESAAFAASLINPDVIVLGGVLSEAGDHLVAGVREVIYQRVLPLATRQLRIVPTRFTTRAGIAGAAYLARDHMFEPAVLEKAISRDLFRRVTSAS